MVDLGLQVNTNLQSTRAPHFSKPQRTQKEIEDAVERNIVNIIKRHRDPKLTKTRKGNQLNELGYLEKKYPAIYGRHAEEIEALKTKFYQNHQETET